MNILKKYLLVDVDQKCVAVLYCTLHGRFCPEYGRSGASGAENIRVSVDKSCLT
jgi:hypothetical protein